MRFVIFNMICFVIMSIFKKQDKKQINFLELTPKRIYSHEFRNEDKLVNVLVPKFTDRILGKFLQPRLKHKYIKANLDQFGSSVWLKINGNNRVSKIAESLTLEFGEEIQPVDIRLTTFFSQLYHAGFITFIELERK